MATGGYSLILYSWKFSPGENFRLFWWTILHSENFVQRSIVHTVHACHSIFGRGVFIRELHPLLPGEQLTRWAKLNSVKFLCQYKAWALSEIFIQWKFCAIRYILPYFSSSVAPTFIHMSEQAPGQTQLSFSKFCQRWMFWTFMYRTHSLYPPAAAWRLCCGLLSSTGRDSSWWCVPQALHCTAHLGECTVHSVNNLN